MRGCKNRAGGFTIVELLLATAIFSTVLMVVIAGFLQIGRLFYKGVALTNTQQVARQIVNNVSNDVRYNNAVTLHKSDIVPDNDVFYLCIGNVRYTYHLYHLVAATDSFSGANNKDYGILRDTLSGSTGCDDPYKSGDVAFNDPKELLSANMRLNDFSVSSLSGGQVYDIIVDVVSGDDNSVDPVDKDFPNGPQKCDANLKNSQYCAQSKLTTSITVNTGALNATNLRKNGVIVKKGGEGHGTVTSTVNASDNPGVDITNLGSLDCGGTCQVVFPNVVTIVMNATSKDPYSKLSKWTFNNSQTCIKISALNPNKQPTCKLKVEGGVYVTAVYSCSNPSGSCDYTVNASKTGSGSGSISAVSSNTKIDCGSLCSETFDTEQTIVLKATPAANSKFKNWNYTCRGSGETTDNPNKCTVIVNKPINIAAKFACAVAVCSWSLTIDKSGDGDGTVQNTPDPNQPRKIDCGNECSATFDKETTVSLVAIPNDSSNFEGWGDSCIGGSNKSNPCKVLVNNAITWVAKFSKK